MFDLILHLETAERLHLQERDGADAQTLLGDLTPRGSLYWGWRVGGCLGAELRIESIEGLECKTSDHSPMSTSSLKALVHIFTPLSSSAASRPPVAPTVTTQQGWGGGGLCLMMYSNCSKTGCLSYLHLCGPSVHPSIHDSRSWQIGELQALMCRQQSQVVGVCQRLNRLPTSSPVYDGQTGKEPLAG